MMNLLPRTGSFTRTQLIQKYDKAVWRVRVFLTMNQKRFPTSLCHCQGSFERCSIHQISVNEVPKGKPINNFFLVPPFLCVEWQQLVRSVHVQHKYLGLGLISAAHRGKMREAGEGIVLPFPNQYDETKRKGTIFFEHTKILNKTVSALIVFA